MMHIHARGNALKLAWLVAGLTGAWASAQTSNLFTVQIGAPVPPPTPLVSHGETWHYRLGTNAPQANWQTAADAVLDATWASAPGGFGYGDPGIQGEATPIVISNVCSTLYLRRSFVITNEPAPNARLQLIVDYDDGFVAYLDGQELTRANLTNGPGTAVANTATTGGRSHEASCCDAGTHPAETFDCGAVSNRLAAGTHVLALIGVNGTRASSDFHLIADLRVSEPSAGPVSGALLSVVTTNALTLTGSNTVAGSTRVVINGDEADFNPAQGTWTKTVALEAGMNQLAIQALDPVGRILAATNRLVVADLESVSVGGLLPANTVWAASNGVVRLTNTVVVPAGGNLVIQEGVVVLPNPNCSLRATNGTIWAEGGAERRIYFLPADGATTNWGGVVVSGTNGALTLRQVELAAGYVELRDGARGLLEDTTLRDYKTASPAILHTLGTPNAVTFQLRRCHITRYHEVLSQLTTNYFEGCLLEYQDYSGDGIDFDGGRPGSCLRRCTLRYGNIYNTDALDIGEYSANEPSRGVLIESCLLHDFVDKGVSMGVQVDVTVSNCVIYNVESGIAVKDLSTAGIYNNTITEAAHGFHCYNKANPGATNGGGLITNAFNNILWQFTDTTLSLENGSTLEASYCDFAGTNWPGTGNISVDPQFIDPLRHDYRLAAGSPLLTAGFNGTAMGAAYPVGGIPPAPWNLAALTLTSNQVTLTWVEDADNEDGFEIQRSTDRRAWQTIGAAAANATEFADPNVSLGQPYYYRVRATNDLGVSGWSGLAGATLRAPVNVVGGALAGDAVWRGTVYVAATVTVPSNVTLTVLPGTVVKLTNAASLSAQAGGTIAVAGEFTNRVRFEPWTADGAWGNIGASGADSRVTIRHAELDHGGVNLGSQATGIIEDSYIHDVFSAIVANSARSATVRRCHVRNFSETIYNSTPVLAEDLLLEDMTAASSDALEIQGANAAWGCVVRRCEARHATGSNSDAIDFNGSSGVLLEDCVIHDFTDKGISLGASGAGGAADFGITVRNCLVYQVDTGIAVKDGSTVGLFQSTIVDSATGLRLYQKYTTPADGGHVTNGFNNIIWGHTNAVVLEDNSSLNLDFSVVQGTNWPGTGNLSADPLFVDAAQHDYRLSAESPCVGTGSNGLSMGVIFPIGIYLLPPANLLATAATNGIALTWQDHSVNESVFQVERSPGGTNGFVVVATLPAGTTSFTDAEALPGHDYRYRVRARSIVADSDYSNEAWVSGCPPPTITAAPASQLAVPGGTASFSVDATGCGPLAYQWRRNLEILAGATNATLTLTNVVLADAGEYRVIVTDAIAQSTTSAVATLTVVAPPQLELAAGGGMDTNGCFGLKFHAPPNLTVVIEASANFQEWQPLQTNQTGSGAVDFADPASANFRWRFYRIHLRP